MPELQTINVYGTDITALRAIDKFPDENPNPVLRVTRGGRVLAVYEFDSVNLYGTDVTAARALEQANQQNERLLLAILPPSIAERLRRGETTIADSVDEMTVLYADLVGITATHSRSPRWRLG